MINPAVAQWKILRLGVEKMGEVLMAIMETLLDRMVFEVRAISVDYDEEKKVIYLLFYLEKELPQEDQEDFEKAAREAENSTQLPIIAKFFVRPMPERFPMEGRLIYYRQEPYPDEIEEKDCINRED